MQNMMKMMKQLKDAKKMQRQLARMTVEASSSDGRVTVVAQGDMSIKSIRIAPESMSETPERLAKTIASTVNSALDAAKKAAAGDMSKLAEEMGLGGLLGG